MSDFSLIKCPQFLDNAITPPAKEIGKTLGNIFYTIFSPINYNVEKLKIKHSENLKKYQDDIQNELDKIPETKLVEPRLSIIGPALEASKFYIEEEEIRKMFAKLISTSMNADTISKSHPSFIEIIKQLTPDEAKIISLFGTTYQFPLITVRGKLNKEFGTGFLTFLSNFNLLAEQAKCAFPKLTINYIENISRLGLANILTGEYSTDAKAYEPLEQHLYVKIFSDKIKSSPKYEDVEFRKGLYVVTDLGKQFYDACVAD